MMRGSLPQSCAWRERRGRSVLRERNQEEERGISDILAERRRGANMVRDAYDFL